MAVVGADHQAILAGVFQHPVEIVMDLEDWGEIRRVIEVPG